MTMIYDSYLQHSLKVVTLWTVLYLPSSFIVAISLFITVPCHIERRLFRSSCQGCIPNPGLWNLNQASKLWELTAETELWLSVDVCAWSYPYDYLVTWPNKYIICPPPPLTLRLNRLCVQCLSVLLFLFCRNRIP